MASIHSFVILLSGRTPFPHDVRLMKERTTSHDVHRRKSKGLRSVLFHSSQSRPFDTLTSEILNVDTHTWIERIADFGLGTSLPPVMASTDQLHVANLFSMKDAVCLVTGGGTGIGLMAAQALAANGTPPQYPLCSCL